MAAQGDGVTHCSQCGTVLDVGDLGGLCPKCLVHGAFDSSVGAGEARADGASRTIAAADDGDFGRYRIVRPLGEGGMGTVYLAAQHDPIRREVALKVVKLGMDTSQVLARFANERQALAILDHPNIARIFDAGATSKGRPYFVMEYIPGEAITDYCDGKRMPIGERLELFLTVCRGVQHAHQKGVIHRDLKPSNVLVMERDGSPLAKVIDFGIAKATDRWAIEKTLLTQFGQLVGTPEYASPEQADVVTGDVDARSDVYALGVLLYEVLVGTPPFDAARLRQAGLNEMLRIIREEDAPPPSHRLAVMGAGAIDIATCRQTDPPSLHRLVDGDLTSVALKALEKVPARRYTSAAELAEDIQRYLEHRPVLAMPPSRVYRARKFLRRNKSRASGTAAAFAFMALTGLIMWSLAPSAAPPKPTLTEKDTVVLADFTNRTGDPAFDGALRQGLSFELEHSPFTVISDSKVQQMLPLMGQPKDARVTSDLARQICERTASAMTLEGSIATLGSEYVLGLRARLCTTGSLFDQQQIQVGRQEEVLNALGQITRRFRARAGESLATVERRATLPETTTSSIEALKAYSTGGRIGPASSGQAAAIPFYRRAVELDPEFAMAHARLSLAYSSVGESVLSAEHTKHAWRLRDRVSDRERFFIDFTYDRQVTGNLEKAYQTLELWFQTYPHAEQPNPHSLLGGISTHGTGRYDRAIEASREEIALNPDFGMAYGNLAGSYFLTGRFTEAEQIIQTASERKLDFDRLVVLGYMIGVLKADQKQMDRAVTLAKGRRRTEHWIMHEQALALARSGRLRAARFASARAVDLARQEGEHEAATMYLAARAMWEAMFGNVREAEEHSKAALEGSNGRDVEYVAALAQGLAGDSSRSDALATDLEKRFPEDTFARFTYVPVLRASAALGRGETEDTVDLLQGALPYELAANGLNFQSYYVGGLHSAYLRGQAMMARRQYSQAAAEFQKILDHRGLVGLDPIDPLAHLQLARTLALMGDKAKARAAYQDFLTLWKDADSEIPLLASARAECARLP
jgi:serine/threonine protein kinase/tetratricopeptide (TPR) repeat protein